MRLPRLKRPRWIDEKLIVREQLRQRDATERRGALREEAAAIQQPQAMGSEMLSVHDGEEN